MGCKKCAEGICGCSTMNAEESAVQEPDWIPDGDGRAIGQQNFGINLSPLHAETFNAELGFKCKFCGSTAEGLDTWDDDYCSRACEKGLTVCGISDGKGQNGSYGEFCDIQYRGKSDADDNKIIIHIGCPNCEFSEDGWGMSFNQEMKEGYRAEIDNYSDEVAVIRNRVGDSVGIVQIDDDEEDIESVQIQIINDQEDLEILFQGVLEAESFNAETTGSPSPTFNAEGEIEGASRRKVDGGIMWNGEPMRCFYCGNDAMYAKGVASDPEFYCRNHVRRSKKGLLLVADTVGTPSPTFNEEITGQDGPSETPTNSNFSAEGVCESCGEVKELFLVKHQGNVCDDCEVAPPYPLSDGDGNFSAETQTFEAMRTLAPSTRDVDSARTMLRNSGYGEVIYDRYIVNQQGSSNKFYYTAITEKDGKYYPMGAYGRIGYLGTLFNVAGKKERPMAHFGSMEEAYRQIRGKEVSKINARKPEKRYVDYTLTRGAESFNADWGGGSDGEEVVLIHGIKNGKTATKGHQLGIMEKDKFTPSQITTFSKGSHNPSVNKKNLLNFAESLEEIEGPTAEATTGGLHSPSSFAMTWEDGTGQSSASIPPNEIAWAETSGIPLWIKVGAGIALVLAGKKLVSSRSSAQKAENNLKSAVKARKGCCGSSKTVRKDSEFSVGQINPVEVEGQSDVYGAEELHSPQTSAKVSQPNWGPQTTYLQNQRSNQKMW